MFGGRTAGRQRRRPTLIQGSGGGGLAATRRHKPDYWLLILSSLLMGVGLVVVYSISPGLAALKGVSDNYYVTKQLVAILLGVIAFLITAWLPLRVWRRLSWPLALSAVVAVIAAFLAPIDEATRAHRWIVFGGFSFQVAELMKFALLIGVANFLLLRRRQGLLGDFKATLRPLLILILALGLVGVKFQSDLGSTAVMLAIIGGMAFISGLPLRRIALVGLVVAVGFMLAIASSDYRRDRVLTFLNPGQDCQSSGYQACQALIAVGSGGLLGLGLGHSVQAYGYLPEASNDSIFAIMAEKFGFLGVSMILAVYVVLIARLKRVAERVPDEFNRLLVVGVLAWLSTQMIINVGAMLGLLPLKGITLPFISYGGTSMIFLTAAVGLVFQISRYTSYGVTTTYESSRQATSNRPDRRRFGRAYNPHLVSRPRA